MFRSGSGEGSKDMFITGEDESDIVCAVASDVEDVLSIEHPNFKFFRILCKFHLTSGSIW